MNYVPPSINAFIPEGADAAGFSLCFWGENTSYKDGVEYIEIETVKETLESAIMLDRAACLALIEAFINGMENAPHNDRKLASLFTAKGLMAAMVDMPLAPTEYGTFIDMFEADIKDMVDAAF